MKNLLFISHKIAKSNVYLANHTMVENLYPRGYDKTTEETFFTLLFDLNEIIKKLGFNNCEQIIGNKVQEYLTKATYGSYITMREAIKSIEQNEIGFVQCVIKMANLD